MHINGIKNVGEGEEWRWRGEEFDDMGTISVEDNEVEVLEFVQPGICRGRGFSYRKWGL